MPDYQRKQKLTSRQEEVLSLVRKGLTNGEICRALNISENTVKVHLANIYKILEVTNRTEAVSANPSKEIESVPQKQNVNVVFEPDPDLKNHPLAHSLYLSVVEALYHYHLFSISTQEDDTVKNDVTYRIKFSVAQSWAEMMFVSLCYRKSKEILWSTQQKVSPDDDISTLAGALTSALFRNMTLSATKKFEEKQNVSPLWWYASCYTIARMMNRNKEAFTNCETILTPLAERDGNLYATYSLVLAYYISVVENWGSTEKYLQKMGQYACTAIRNNPYSIYSQFMMALYNILIGNKIDAIGYFKQIIKANPYDTLARRLLVQIYLLVGQEDEALRQLEAFKCFSPQSDDTPYLFVVRAFIYFLQGNYDECEKLAKQALLVYPEAPFARLFLVACNNKKELFDESQRHINLFFEYHPNFTKADLDKLMVGIAPTRKKIFADSLKNMFP